MEWYHGVIERVEAASGIRLDTACIRGPRRRSEGQGMTGWEAPFQRAWVLLGTASLESAVVEATSEA
eukprot:622208-Pyramimonas_sp.AAC.1